MARNHTAPFQRTGPRAQRALLRDAKAAVEQDIESHVRTKMRPSLTGAARQALASFKRERGR